MVAASDDVIEPSADFDPWFARHGGAEFIDPADQVSMKSSLIMIQKEAQRCAGECDVV